MKKTEIKKTSKCDDVLVFTITHTNNVQKHVQFIIYNDRSE